MLEIIPRLGSVARYNDRMDIEGLSSTGGATHKQILGLSAPECLHRLLHQKKFSFDKSGQENWSKLAQYRFVCRPRMS